MELNNNLKREHRGENRNHDNLDGNTSRQGYGRLQKAVSCNMLDMVCKRRRTAGRQSPCFHPAPTNQWAEQPADLAQLLSQLCASSSKSAAKEEVFRVLRTLQALAAKLSSKDGSACDAAVLTMKRFPHSLSLQAEGCLVIRRYAKATSSLTSDSLFVLLRALGNRSSYLRYLAIDCMRMASRDASSRILISGHYKCTEIVLKTLGASPKDARMQELGVSLISFLVEEVVCRKQIIDHGGVNIIVESMKNHATNALIQCNSAAAMGWLVHLMHVEAKAALLANVDAIQTILDISKRYVDNASVFGNCICILCGVLVGDRAVAEAFPELGTPTRQLLQLGMRENPKALKVQRNCMMLLRLITESEVETAPLDDFQLQSFNDCIDVSLACMKEFPKESEIQSFGCRILCSLALKTATLALVVGKDGCTNQVVSALGKHKADTGVLQGACCFLQAILQAGAGQPGPRAFGGGLSVLGIMLNGLGVNVVNRVEEW